MKKNSRLNDPNFLFTILVSLIKRGDGELRISSEDVLKVTKRDLVALMFDKETEEIILKLMPLPTQDDKDVTYH